MSVDEAVLGITGEALKAELLDEAVEAVRAIPSSELQAVATQATETLEEPPLEGDTSFGINPKWLDWFAQTTGKRYRIAIKVGKRLLREKQLKKRVDRHRPRPHKPYLEKQ